jgi:zinc and cadmium transporter
MIIIGIIAAVFIGNVASVLLASLLLRLNSSRLQKSIRHINAFAGGTLLGAAFLGMLPNAVKQLNYQASYIVLGGILFFFVIEKVMLWRVCNNEHCNRHSQSGALMLMIGDSFHNFLDGIVIAAAFLNNQAFGIIVAISVFAHEIPQEVADFGVMIKAGFSKQKTIWYNIFSGFTAFAGAFAAWFYGVYTQMALPYILAISAAGFIYIALADLIPDLHRKSSFKEASVQFLLLLTGIGVIIVSIMYKP